MPYFIKKAVKGWNTIKSDGTVVGSHATKQGAIDQMVAVSLAEKLTPGGEMRASFTPPQGVSDAAKRALEWIDKGLAGSGFTAVGRRRAEQLASGSAVSEDVVARMRSYFARHEVDKKATGFNFGEKNFPTPGRVAWDAWGGDAGQKWANSLGSKMTTRDAGMNIGISDIDDTLIVEGKIHQDYYAWLDHQPVDLYLVTGRPTTDRESTIAQLNNLGVQYQQLIMNPGGDPNQFKGDTASSLMEDGYNIAFAVDNNPEARQAYEDAGVGNVYDPAKMPAMAAMAQRDGAMDEMPEPVAAEATEETPAYLAGELSELLGNLVAAKFLAHGAHWNVKGVLFPQFHKFFQKIYEDYDSAIDPMAENIRKLDMDAPFMLPTFVADTEIDATFIGGDPVQLSLAIYKANEMLLSDIVETQQCADELNQQGIFNFLADLQDRFSLWHWQLGTVIGDDLRNAYATEIEEVGEIHDPVQPTDEMEPAPGDYEGVDASGATNIPVTVEGRFVDPKFVQENRESGMKLLEQRTVTENIEFRQEGDGMTFSGYAATFNAPSQPLPFTEVIKPGAFKRSLGARNDIKLLWNHDTGQVLGSTRAGTLMLSEDERGLKVTAKLPNTSAGRDAAELIKRGDVNAMSFGFSVPQGGDNWSEDGNTRELNSVRLHEVSIVAFPAYESTAGTTSMRSGEQAEQKAADLSLLRKRLDLQK
jgi:HK97 family phage prohead protease